MVDKKIAIDRTEAKPSLKKICAVKDVRMTTDGIIPNIWYAP
jgi:hypothetical protein